MTDIPTLDELVESAAGRKFPSVRNEWMENRIRDDLRRDLEVAGIPDLLDRLRSAEEALGLLAISTGRHPDDTSWEDTFRRHQRRAIEHFYQHTPDTEQEGSDD